MHFDRFRQLILRSNVRNAIKKILKDCFQPFSHMANPNQSLYNPLRLHTDAVVVPEDPVPPVGIEDKWNTKTRT